jgi:hypothetical protein
MFFWEDLLFSVSPPLFHHPFHLLSFSHTQTTITFPLVTKNLLCLFCSVGFVISVGCWLQAVRLGAGKATAVGGSKAEQGHAKRRQGRPPATSSSLSTYVFFFFYYLYYYHCDSLFRTKGVLTWGPGRRHLLSLAVLSYYPYYHHYYGVGCVTGKKNSTLIGSIYTGFHLSTFLFLRGLIPPRVQFVNLHVIY